jgi:hypothetical protein
MSSLLVLFSYSVRASPVVGGPDCATSCVDDQAQAERKRVIVKVFDVDANDALTVDNQYGSVAIDLWDKSEIRVQVTITANADSDERMQRMLDAVDIDEKRSGNQIIIKTNFEKVSNWNIIGLFNKGDQHYVRIDYVVSMPRQNALTVRNRFGNTSIPSFQAALSVYNRYGNFVAQSLTGRQTDIDVAYGKANIGSMEAGKIDIAYSKLDLEQANLLTLINKFGNFRIGEVGRLDADVNYSGATIGMVRQSAKVRLSFSGSFRIDQMPATADNLDIRASYSSVTLPVQNLDYDFDVTVKYGHFNLPDRSRTSFTAQPGPDSHSNNTRQYSGKIGRGTGPRLHIVTSYGNVNFK